MVTGLQQQSWFFAPTRVDFTATSASAVAVAGAPASSEATAAAYDAQNNLLFYVVRNSNFTVYGPDNTSLGSLGGVTAPNGDGFGLGMGEMAVVPIPGLCRAYYLFYTLGGPFGGAVCYARVNCPVGSAPVIQSYSTILDYTSRSRTSIAVGKPRPDGTRILYDVSDGGVRYCTLNVGGGFSAVTNLGTTGLPQNSSAYWELDISPDNRKMAWTMSTPQNLSTVCIVPIIPSTGAPDLFSITNYSAPAGAVGVEFSGSGTKLYVAAPGSVSVLDFGTSPLALAPIDNTADADCTQLETAFDGLVYYVNTSGRLKTINPCTNEVAASPVPTILTKSRGILNPPVYLLPDQLDGENYALASGTANPTIGAVRVDNQLLSPSAVSSVYNCNPLALSVASLAGAMEVQVTLTPTNSAGTVTGSAVCTTGWLAAPPAEIKSLCGGYLSDAANAGYYQVKLEARSLCGQLTTFTGRILVSALTAASAGFQFNPCSGNLVDPNTTSQAAPLPVGMYGGGIDLSFSTGLATSYQVRFEQFDSGTGAGQPIGNPINVAGQPSSTASFSYLANLAGLGAGYFTPGNPGNNRTHRLTLTLTNQCGVSPPLTGYFLPSLACRPAAGGPIKPTVSIYPNPLARGVGRLEFTLPTAQRVSLSIVDGLTGQEKLVLLHDAARPAGSQTVEFDATALPAGVYLYRLVTNEVQVGRLLKAE